MARRLNRCFSCKKLKIKCDEAKPACEYCLATNKLCAYPKVIITNKVLKRHPSGKSSSSSHSTTSSHQKRRSKYHVEEIKPHPVMAHNELVPLPQPHMLLFSTTSQLHVNQFELRLLHFFQHFCIPAFTKGAPGEVSSVWKNEIPFLWKQSDLLRKSIYLFSAMNLWPLCDLKSLLENDMSIDKIRTFQKMEYIVDPEDRDNLYINTIEYFGSSLRTTLGEIGAMIAQGGTVSVYKSAEILLSGIIIFSFLGMHPHRIVPLVSFADEDDADTPDLLSICDGLRVTFLSNITVLLSSPFGGIFRSDECMEPDGPLQYPIIENLKFRLETEKEKDNDNYEAFRISIEQLETCLFRSVTLKYPRPLFRWILLQDDLSKCVKKKVLFALKVLFNFACLCYMCKFHVFSTSNMWLDYIEWYRNFNYRICGAGMWKDMDDFLIYEFVLHKLTRESVTAEQLATFDPFSVSDLDKEDSIYEIESVATV